MLLNNKQDLSFFILINLNDILDGLCPAYSIDNYLI